VLFADLDGTLLNGKYDFVEVEPIIKNLLSLNVSIVLNSSKTRWEMDFYRKNLGITDPFIVENGSAILIPKNYFKASYRYTQQVQDYYIIQLGRSYSEIREKLALVKTKTNANIVGFGDMTIEEIARDSGLPLHLAQLAKKREYDEPFRILEGDEKKVLNAINAEGLCYTTGGRYFHMLGNCNKGKALCVLKNLYLQEFKKVVTIGVGDSANDLPMLQLVDKPFRLTSTTDNRKVWQEILTAAHC